MKKVHLFHFNDYVRTAIPSHVSRHPSMISESEKRFLFHYTRQHYEGTGFIFDGGILLGGSTACFAEALGPRAEALRGLPFGKPIKSYDRLKTPHFSKDPHARRAVFKSRGIDDLFAPGVSYAPLVQQLLAPYDDLVELHVGDILAAPLPRDTPCEIAFLDVLKTPAIDRHVFHQVFRNLVPGKSLIVHQDYFYDRLAFLRVRQEFLSSFFEYVGEIRTTAIFRLIRALPEVFFEHDPVADLPAETQLQLVEVASRRSVDPARQLLTRLSGVRLSLELFGPERAQAELAAVDQAFGATLHASNNAYLQKAHASVREEIRAATTSGATSSLPVATSLPPVPMTPNGGTEARVEAFIAHDLKTIEGYLSADEARLFGVLGAVQDEAALRGDIVELGVWRGRSALLLYQLLWPGERLHAVDIFDLRSKDHAFFNDPAIFRAHCERLGALEQTNVVKMDTTRSIAELEARLAPGSARLVHVDGGHTYNVAKVDIAFAFRTVHENGLVACDDVLLRKFPGVTQAFIETCLAYPDFEPILLSKKKVWVAHRKMAAQYKARIREAAGRKLVEREFMGGVALLVDQFTPKSKPVAASALA